MSVDFVAADTRASGGATRGLLQIGEVADRTGLSLRTVRHYEEVGLLPPAERSPGGFRLYGQAAVDRLLVIKQLKPLEFSLEQMQELLDAVDELKSGPAVTRRRELHDVISALQRLVAERTSKLRERLLGEGAAGLAGRPALVTEAGPTRLLVVGPPALDTATGPQR